jgi:hypothetical protein
MYRDAEAGALVDSLVGALVGVLVGAFLVASGVRGGQQRLPWLLLRDGQEVGRERSR